MSSALFDVWREAAEKPKVIFDWPSWEANEVVRLSKKQAGSLGHKPFRSSDAERLSLLAQLADVNGPSIEGLRLRLEAWANRPMCDLTATLELLDGAQWVCLSRVDVAPYGPHSNKDWRTLGIPPDITGSHFHAFSDNVKLGKGAFAPTGNLPAARPLGREPDSFREFVVVVGQIFNIDGSADLPCPEWQKGLF